MLMINSHSRVTVNLYSKVERSIASAGITKSDREVVRFGDWRDAYGPSHLFLAKDVPREEDKEENQG
jgi:hypothetical protein